MRELLIGVDALSAMSASVELFAAVVAAMLLTACLIESGFRNSVTRYLMAILALHVVVLSCDAAVWIIDGASGFESLTRILVMFIDFMSYVALALFALFITKYVGQFAPIPNWVSSVAVSTCAAMAILWAAATVGGELAYNFNAGGHYVEGLFYWVGTASCVAILLFNIFLVARHRKALKPRTAVVLLLYSILPLFGLLLQPFWDVTPAYLGSTIALVLCYAVVHVDQAHQLAVRERELAESRVAIAVSQIQPHFLFNALNSIHYLCGTDSKAAQLALQEFSDYLRMNIDSIGVTKPVFFLAELDHINTYLKLEKMRFEDDLNVEYDIQASDFKVPPLSVQPLVENAVKHGVCKKIGGGTVRISTRELFDSFEICISDDGVGFDMSVKKDDGREHVGISNVRERLWSICKARLEITSGVGVGTSAVISIPKEGV